MLFLSVQSTKLCKFSFLLKIFGVFSINTKKPFAMCMTKINNVKKDKVNLGK